MNREQKRALAIVVSMSFAPIGVLGKKASVPVTWLLFLLVGAGLCQAFAFFAAILVQYDRGGQG
jgi:hypothetical protein